MKKFCLILIISLLNTIPTGAMNLIAGLEEERHPLNQERITSLFSDVKLLNKRIESFFANRNRSVTLVNKQDPTQEIEDLYNSIKLSADKYNLTDLKKKLNELNLPDQVDHCLIITELLAKLQTMPSQINFRAARPEVQRHYHLQCTDLINTFTEVILPLKTLHDDFKSRIGSKIIDIYQSYTS